MSSIKDVLGIQSEVSKSLSGNLNNDSAVMDDGVVVSILGNYQYSIRLKKGNSIVTATSFQESGNVYLQGSQVSVLKKGNSFDYQIIGFKNTGYSLGTLPSYQV